MKQNILEHIIRTIITEQESLIKVKSEKPWKVRTVFKRDLGSASNEAEAKDAGAVFGFRIKAVVKNATKKQIDETIKETINQDTQLSKYLNGNYLFIRSTEQHEDVLDSQEQSKSQKSKRNYLYNYWIIPKAYIQDILWVYNDKVKPGSEKTYSYTLGLPADIKSVTGFGGLPTLNNNTHQTSIETLIQNFKLKTIDTVINLPYIDPKRYTRAYEWVSKLKKINKKIPSKDLKDPAEIQKIPEVATISENDPIQIALSKQSVFGKGIINIKNLYFAGNYDVKNSAPLEGKVSYDSDFNEVTGPLYIGTLKKTAESVDPEVGSTIKAVDFDTGKAISYPVRISNLQNVVNTENTAWLYSGNISNGRLASDATGTTGQLQIKINNILYTYTGTFKNNLAWDGIVLKSEGTTSNFLYRFISGQRVPYQAYVGAIYPASENIHILAVKSEMQKLFTQFLKEFKPEEFPDPKDFNLINKFIQSPVTDKWDSEMSKLVQCLNGMLYVYFQVPGFTEKDSDVDNKITEPVRKWISKYHQAIPTPKR